jgi:hypothetical protein
MKYVGTTLHALSICVIYSAQVLAQSADDLRMVREIQAATNRDSMHLRRSVDASGRIDVDLAGGFLNVVLAKVENGETALGCVDELNQANRFFGRDLTTGRELPQSKSKSQSSAREAIEVTAARHGMTVNELSYYQQLIKSVGGVRSPNAATFTIQNIDTAGVGFNDTTFASPVGGNNGSTLGAQRLNLFNEAARIWGLFLDSTVSTKIKANFAPLTCNATQAVLGQAGTAGLPANFANAPFSNTVYVQALANKIAGSDLNGSTEEIVAQFSSNIDTGTCLGGKTFYYGFDNSTPANKINLLIVLLHEFGHGLGSATSVNVSTGALFSGMQDAWTRQMWDASNGLFWSAMSDSQRAASAINNGNLFWDSASVRIAAPSYLTAGADASGRVRLYAPTPLQPGSSVSHFDTTATPNLLMEPAINVGIPLTLDLTRQQLRDIGWARDTDANVMPDTVTAVTPSGGNVYVGATRTITWSNGGGFNKNVTIELSTSSGSTFPTVIASNIANTGSFSWTVPNTLTNTARIRVREFDFATPAGISITDFQIRSNSPPSMTVTGGTTTVQQGGPTTASAIVASVSDLESSAGSLVVTAAASSGVTVGSISNLAGSISTNFAASCAATTGGRLIPFTVTDDGGAFSSQNVSLNVTVNTPPSAAYAAQNLNIGAGATVNPASALTDNGAVTGAIIQSSGTYTGTVSVSATGVITLSNAQPAGAHTVTVRFTDNCNATTDVSLLINVNSAPTISASSGLQRTQGGTATSSVIATVSDSQTAAGSLTVTTTSIPAGLTLTGLTNAAGSVSATVGASCTAPLGANNIGLQVSDGSLNTTANTSINVLANSAPSLAYSNQSALINSALTISPNTLPADNGMFTLSLFSTGTYTGNATLNTSTGVLSLTNAAPAGSHTITVRAIDNCGAITDATILLTIATVNTAPTISAASGLSQQQGSPLSAAVNLATVSDGQTAAGSLLVSAIAGGTATGVTLSNVSNANGNVTGQVLASCTASSGTLRLQVSDGALSSTADVNVNVILNSAPTLGTYANYALSLNQSGSVTPSATPADNGSVSTLTATTAATFTGTLSANPLSGVLSINNAGPLGNYTINLAAVDNCGASTPATTTLEVNNDALFTDGFE